MHGIDVLFKLLQFALDPVLGTLSLARAHVFLNGRNCHSTDTIGVWNISLSLKTAMAADPSPNSRLGRPEISACNADASPSSSSLRVRSSCFCRRTPSSPFETVPSGQHPAYTVLAGRGGSSHLYLSSLSSPTGSLVPSSTDLRRSC